MIPRREPRVELPVNAIRRNLIFARGRVAGVYRVPMRSFQFLSLSDKQELHGHLATWMMKVERDFSIYRVCRDYPAARYPDDTVDLIDERVADRSRWERLLERHAAHMSSMRAFVPECYVVVALDAPSMVSRLRSQKDVRADVDDGVLASLSHFGARRATTLEIQWLLRRAAVRGVCEPNVDPSWAPPALSLDGGEWSPGRADTQSFMPVVTNHVRHVRVEGEDGDSLQAMLVMGKLPRSSEYPGSAELLLGPLEKLDFPVDAVVHVRWRSNKKMLGLCDNVIKDAHDEVDDASGRFVERRTLRRATEAASVQDYFASEPYPPGLETMISLAVGAESHKQLDDRVDRLRRAYGGVHLYRPTALQAKLFDDHMLRPDGGDMGDHKLSYRRDYRRLMIAEQLAATMPIGANQGGATRGLLLAHTIPGALRWVKFNPLEAAQMGRTGAVLINGTLGSGKTIAVQLIAYLAAMRGSLVVDIDPKHPRPDHKLDRLPDLADRTHVIAFDDVDAYRGRLDPLVVAPEGMREELASGYMMDILPQAKPEWQTEIIAAVRYVLQRPDPCSRAVIEHLLSSSDEHARAAGKALNVWSDWGLGKLAVSDGRTDDVDVHMPVTMIKASALTLPPAGTPRSSYDQSERVSVATLKLIVARAMRMLSGDRSVHKLLVIDEAHVLAATVDGRRFLERVIRMGRYMNITPVLASQLLGDLSELGQLIGQMFVMRQETTAEAAANLRMLGLDGDDRNLQRMLTEVFEKGACLMRGLDGRVVSARFDFADPDALAALDTDPLRALEDQLEPTT